MEKYLTLLQIIFAGALDHPGDKKYGWDSKKGARGILKKVGYMAVIAAAIALDYVTLVMASQMGLDVKKSVFFGLLATAWYILNELFSITENAGRMGADVPDWLARYIAALKDKIDDKGEGAE